MKQKILVVGAGELGQPVLQELVRANFAASISVLLPPNSKTRPGVEVVEADLGAQSAQELAALFASYTHVVGCTGFVAGPGTQLKLAEAAVLSGIEHYLPWQFGVDYDVIGKGSGQPVFDEQLEVRQMLRSQQRIKWTILSTGMFLSFLFVPEFGLVDLKKRRVRALADWDYQLSVTAPQDIGRLVAQILQDSPRYADQVLYAAGDTLSYRKLAETLERVLGYRFERELWTLEHLCAELENQPEDTMRRYRLAFARPDGVAWPLQETLNARLQLPMLDVSSWLECIN